MPKRRILIVDDDPDFTMILRERLEANGYDILSAGNGLAALRLLNEIRHHVAVSGIVLDVQMPVMNGLETIRPLRERFSDIPVLMMSAVPHQAIIDESLRLGAAGFLKKSDPPLEFLARCRQIFGHVEDESSESGPFSPDEDG